MLDTDGDLAIVQSKKNANYGYFNYADSFTYTAAGALSSMQLGNGRWESTQFNSRLQPTQIALGTVQNATDKLKLNFTYNTAGQNDNNGNVLSQTITVPTTGNVQGFTAVQNYTYDSLNRLKSATENINSNPTPEWKQTFQYDRYGNRRFDEANTTTLTANCPTAVCNPTVDAATNKLVGYTFDNAGNTKVDAMNRQFIYDAENKQIEVRDAQSTTIGKYYYDGDGKRVKKVVPATGETTILIYDASGKLVAEYSTVTNTNPQVSYLTSDHLGSPRINTDASGAVTARHDYQPFGEEIARASYGADAVRKQFTGYEKDEETELDFAQARMYSNQIGRFTTTDPLLNTGRPSKPQSWNRFSYVVNNPLILIDPSGMYLCTAGKTNCDKFEASMEENRRNLEKIKEKYTENSDEYKKAKAAVDVYGNKDEDNGVTVALAGKKSNLPPDAAAETDVKRVKKQKTVLNLEGKSIVVTIAQKAFDSDGLSGLAVHEGSHAADGVEWIKCNFCSRNNLTSYQTEFKAFMVEASFSEASGTTSSFRYDPEQMKGAPQAFGLFQLWNPSWKSVDESKPQIDFFLKHSKLYNKRLNQKAF